MGTSMLIGDFEHGARWKAIRDVLKSFVEYCFTCLLCRDIWTTLSAIAHRHASHGAFTLTTALHRPGDAMAFSEWSYLAGCVIGSRAGRSKLQVRQTQTAQVRSATMH